MITFLSNNTDIILQNVDWDDSLNILLQLIIMKYFTKTYCLTVLSSKKIEALKDSLPFVIIDDLDERKLVKVLLAVSEMGCSDYIVQMQEPAKFVGLLEENRFEGMQRNPDKKIVFLPINLKDKHIENLTNILKIKTLLYIPKVLLIIPKIVNEKSEKIVKSFIMATHSFGNPLEEDFVKLAEWDIELQTSLINKNLFPYNFRNVNKKKLIAATINYEPYVFLGLNNDETHGIDGIDVRLGLEFCKWINCTLEIIDCEEDLWGEIYPNGTGTGILGSVVMDNAEIGFGSITVWYSAFRYLDLSMPNLRTGITVIVPSPRLLAGWRLPLLSFSTSVWIAVILVIPVYAVAFYLVNIEHNWLATTSIILMQFTGLNVEPVSEDSWTWRTRTMLGVPLFATMIIGTAFTVGLASSLTILKYEDPISTAQDLVDSGMEWGATHDAWIKGLMLTTVPKEITLVNKFRALTPKQLKARSDTLDSAFAVERLPAGHFAIGDYVTEEAATNFRILDEDLFFDSAIFILRKGSPYTPIYERFVSQLQSAGLLLAWETEVVTKYMNSKTQLAILLSQSLHNTDIKKLDIQHTLGAFIILILGYIISTITLFIEIAISKKNKNTSQHFEFLE